MVGTNPQNYTECNRGNKMKYNQIKTKLNEEHSLGLLKKVAAQMDKDARNGDYNSIDELLEDIPTERLEGYLSDNLYPYVEESEVSEDKDYNLIAQRKTMNLSDQAIIALIASLYKQLDAKESIDEVEVDNEGNIAGYLATIDEYVEMLFKSAKGTAKDVSLSKESATTIAYRIQNAVDDIRTRELGLKPSNIRAQYANTESVQKKRLVDTGLDLEEGPNDKHIFKAIFMAGGPGSGKSTVADTVLKQFDLKVIDSDKMFEHLMAKKGMDVGDPEQIYSPDGQATRDHGKNLVAKQKEFWLDGKLGVVIDGTGRDIEKTAKIRQEMIDLGYSTMMLYVNTKLAVAQERNLQRKRRLPILKVEQMWRAVQENIMKFQQVFGANRFIVIDNSEGLEDPQRAEAFTKVEGNIRAFLQQVPRNRIAQAWLDKNKKFGWRMH